MLINPFHSTILFLYPLKTLENQMFPRGIERDSTMKWIKIEKWHSLSLSRGIELTSTRCLK